MRVMTMRGWTRLLACCLLAAGSSAIAGPSDEPSPKTKRAKPAPPPAEESPYVDVEKKDVGEPRGLGLRMKPSAECMSAEDAARKKEATQPDPFNQRSERVIEQSREIPECPAAIWVYVGAGHGSRPVGNVSTPLTVATTRKRRRHHKHDCCYLVQQAPGSPNG